MIAASGVIICYSNKEGGFVMEQFNTLLEAAKCIVTRCNSWRFATSDEKYDAKSLMGIAEVSDAENPADEDSFYVVTLGRPANQFLPEMWLRRCSRCSILQQMR